MLTALPLGRAYLQTGNLAKAEDELNFVLKSQLIHGEVDCLRRDAHLECDDSGVGALTRACSGRTRSRQSDEDHVVSRSSDRPSRHMRNNGISIFNANWAPIGWRRSATREVQLRLRVVPIYGYHFNGNTKYNALVTRLEKRFSGGLTVLTSYTFSKAIGDICGASASGDTTNCGYQDLRNLRAERSVDNTNIPHRFVLSEVYELPFGKGRRFASNMPSVANAVLGGWSLGSIVTIASGVPYSISVQGNPANSGTFSVVDRPNVTGDPYATPADRLLVLGSAVGSVSHDPRQRCVAPGCICPALDRAQRSGVSDRSGCG
jgi:hypothetical protein